WYLILFRLMFAFGIISIEVWPMINPKPNVCLCIHRLLVMPFSYVIPIGMIQAITNQQVGFNVITELIIGLGAPNPYQLYFNPYFHIMFSALNLASHFKLGHYMRIPPRPMFWSQVS
ncbi:OPT oligopeptide transporter protein-domain-containing protein, partial [Mycena albidolilacea]